MVISVYIFLKGNAIGQGYFLIHGDNSDTIGNSSEGHMIINGAGLRRRIYNSSDTILVVR